MLKCQIDCLKCGVFVSKLLFLITCLFGVLMSTEKDDGYHFKRHYPEENTKRPNPNIYLPLTKTAIERCERSLNL